jgi:hypothetical protein
MISNKPNIKLDENFAKELRARLMSRDAVAVKGTISPYQPAISPFMRYLKLSSGIVVLALAVFVGTFAFIGERGGGELALSPQFIDKDEQAFGRFASQGDLGSMNARSDESVARMAGGMGTADSAGPSMTLQSSTLGISAAKGMGGDAVSSMIYPYPFIQYTYEYTGDESPLSENSGKALKRLTGLAASQSLLNAINGGKIGGVDLSKFRDLEIQNLAVAENLPGGYTINFDFIGGYIYINKSWKFGDPNAGMVGTQDAKLGDEEAIAIADAFLKARNISRASFGEPRVEKQPEIMPLAYEEDAVRSQEQSTGADTMLGAPEAVSSDSKMAVSYYNEWVSVLYPLAVDGNSVYDEGGNLYGVRVGLNARTKQVDRVYELGVQTFERSTYPLVTDVTRLVNYLNERSAAPDYGDMQVKKETVKLGTPKTALMRHWKYDESKGTSEEYFVPAAIFPIVEGGESHYSREVIVPLMEDLLEVPKFDGPVYRIMEDRPAMQTVE